MTSILITDMRKSFHVCKGGTGALQVRALQSGGWQADKERFSAYTGAAVALANAQVKLIWWSVQRRKCRRPQSEPGNRHSDRPACQ